MKQEQPILPTIPKELVNHNEKKYKWAVPQFKLPGYKEIFISADVSDDTFIIEKILCIDGQGLLIEQY